MIKSQINGLVFVSVSTAAVALFSFVSTSVTTRIVSVSDFGEIALYSTFILFFNSIYNLSLDSAVTRFYHDEGFDRKTLLFLVVALRVAIPLLILIAIVIVALFVTSSHTELKFLLIFTCALISAFAQIIAHVSILYRLEKRFLKFSVISFASQTLPISVGLYALYVFNSVNHYFFSVMIAYGLTAIIIISVSLKDGFWRFSVDWTYLSRLLQFCLPLYPSVFIFMLNSILDRWVIATFLREHDLAFYAISSKVASVAAIGVSVVMMIIQPELMRLINEKSAESWRKIQNYEYLFFYFLWCVFGGFLVFAPVITPIIAPDIYNETWRVSIILAISHLAFGLTYFSTLGLWAASRTFIYSISLALGLALNVILNLFFLRFGLPAIAYATVAGVFLSVIITHIWSHRLCSLAPTFGVSLLNICAFSGIAWVVNFGLLEPLVFQVSGIFIFGASLVIAGLFWKKNSEAIKNV